MCSVVLEYKCFGEPSHFYLQVEDSTRGVVGYGIVQ
jgi:hypothetical protein